MAQIDLRCALLCATTMAKHTIKQSLKTVKNLERVCFQNIMKTVVSFVKVMFHTFGACSKSQVPLVF